MLGIQTGAVLLGRLVVPVWNYGVKIMISEFLTDIANGFNVKIERVEFEKLEPGHLGRVHATKKRDSYHILIDKGKTHCSFQILFILFHEIAHIELFHLGYKFYLSDEGLKAAREKEADEWALKQLGVVEGNGNINDADKVCLQCLQTIPEYCLKGLRFK